MRLDFPKFSFSTKNFLATSVSILAVSLMSLFLLGCDSPSSVDQNHAYVEITTSNFDKTVLNSKQLVLVDFWAPWCGPCVKIGPAIEALAKKYEGRAVVGKVNIDQNKALANRYRIIGIPALLFFRNGELVEEFDFGSSLPTLADLSDKMDELLAN